MISRSVTSDQDLSGDGFMQLEFVRLISQYYQGLEPLDPAPSYHPRSIYSADPDEDHCNRPSLLAERPFSLRDLYSLSLVPQNARPVSINFRLTSSQIAQLQKAIQAMGHDDTLPRLSRQDVIAALLAHCITKADTESPPISQISNIVDVCFLISSSV